MVFHHDKNRSTPALARRRDAAGEESRLAQESPEAALKERISALARTNLQLSQEIAEHKRAEGSLQGAYAEIKHLKERLQAENLYLQRALAQEHDFGAVVGQSAPLQQVLQWVDQVAVLSATVLLRGEAGSGKGVLARSIHDRSARRNQPLITVNLAALPADLVESELFGWERGECTGAEVRQIGYLELADAGTVFLDEIAELPLGSQGKLLRLIRDGELERLGSPRVVKADVRVIATSSRDLEEEVRCGRFREDLYYRLKVFSTTVPPLRQRKDDIPALVAYFITKYCKNFGKKPATVTGATLFALQAYDWPGNVRELESVVERALLTSPGSELQVSDRSDELPTTAGNLGESIDASPEVPEIKALAELEHDYILQVLQKTGWRIEGEHGAAVLLGLNPSTLRARMRKYGILRHYVREEA